MAYRDLAPDVLIIGSGPAGLFCAGRLREAGAENILVIEQGKAMTRRTCPDSPLCDCRPCDVLEGEGCAGSFSDGKITLSPTRGTHGQVLFTPQQGRLLGRVEQIVRQLAATVNAAAGGYPIRQQLGDLLPGCQPPAGVKPTNPKTRPGRLQDVLPAALLDAFCGYIKALGQVEPAVLAADGLVYAPEIKYYAYQVPVGQTWQSTDIAGLYVTGNAAGYTASLSAAALTGIIGADAINGGTPAAPIGQERARS